jgi:phosphate transport system protein
MVLLMSKHLQRDLDNLQREIVGQAAAVEEVVCKAIKALQDRDPALAREIIDGDSTIDEQDNQIEEECLKILALHQPVAIDLRRTATILKINSDLERIADLAEDIAGRAVFLSHQPQAPIPDRLGRMTDLTMAMVRQSIDSFVNLDPRQARRVCRLDDEVDRYHAEIIQELIETMKQHPEFIEPALSLFSVTRHMERIADHATNIAEDVIYLVEGEIVRHRPEAVEVDQ